MACIACSKLGQLWNKFFSYSFCSTIMVSSSTKDNGSQNICHIFRFVNALANKLGCHSLEAFNIWQQYEVVHKRVKHCVEVTGRMDEPNTKHEKYITPTRQNSMQRLANPLRKVGLLGIFCNYLCVGLTPVTIVQIITLCNKFGNLKENQS